MQAHMDGCASCADELRSLKGAADFVDAHRRELSPRPESWNLIRQHLMLARLSAAEPPARSRFFAFNQWRYALAALAVLFVVTIGYQQYRKIDRKDLDYYIARYIQDREVCIPTDADLCLAQTDTPQYDPSGDNPFVEIKAYSVDNPFRRATEDR